MAVLENPQHEAFAQARFARKSVVEAHEAAGLSGANGSASRLNRLPEVQERIAELYRERAAETAYDKAGAVRDLLSIIHTSPADAEEAGAEHPLCEVRMGKDGPYHRFPPKLQAMARLIKLMAWDQVAEPEAEKEEERRDTLTDWLAAERSGRLRGLSRIDADAGVGAERREGDDAGQGPPDVDTIIARMKAQIYGNAGGPASRGQPSTVNGETNANHGPPSQTTANALSPKQESYAMARAKGLGVMAAYQAAGYEGGSANLAWRLNQLPAVRARIAELNGAVEAVTGYGKDDLVRDLVAIVHARPNEAGADHPLCEVRMTSWGKYHRFPSKLAAITLLARVCGWVMDARRAADGAQEPYDPDARLRTFLLGVRERQVEAREAEGQHRGAEARS
jgi:hypothetical protein